MHSIYNLKLNVPNKIPVVFHNGKNYGYHFIIKELWNEFKQKFECLGKNTEKCRTFSVPIEKEVTNIDKDGNESVFTISYKIVYRFEYVDDWKKFNEATLSEKAEVYSNLNIKDTTDADYMYAKRFCKDFETKNLGEYDDLHLKRDTLILADVLENFRKMCLKI